jgi:PAS domain S-box-containing protein
MPLTLLEAEPPHTSLDRQAFAYSGIPDRLAEAAITRLACRAAVINLVDDDAHYLVGRAGLPVWVAPERTLDRAAGAPCDRVVASGDALRIPRLAELDDSDLVRRLRAAGFTSLLGVPVRAPGKGVVGTLTVLDVEPRSWDEADVGVLRELAGCVEQAVVHFRRSSRAEATEAHYRQVFHTSPHPTYVLDATGRLAEVNDAVCALLGGSRTELLGRHFLEVTASEGAATAQRAFTELLSRTRASVNVELPLLRGGVEVRPCLITATSIWRDGTLLGIHGVARDVTDLRAAEAARRASEQRFKALFEQNPVPVAFLDTSLRLVDANPALEEASGRSVADLRAGGLRRFVPRGTLRPLVGTLQQVLAGTAREVDEMLVGLGGEELQVRMSLLPVFVDGDVTGLFAVVEDVGARRKLERQLRHAAKMEAVGRLAGGVAHDFNNLLTVIAGRAELALTEVEDPELRQDLEEIRSTTERGASLTRQLLLFSGRRHSTPRRLDPVEAIAQLQRLLERVLGEDKRLEVRAEGELWEVEMDPGLLDQVILNLVINARDALSAGGRIRLAASNRTVTPHDDALPVEVGPGEYVEVRVDDDGDGMPPQVLERIFEPFFTTKDPGKGTGLGLASVLGIVQRAGGHVWARSTEGEGSTFVVLLPRARREGEGDTGAGEGPGGAGEERPPRGRILVVEDDPAVRTLTCRILQRRGHEVTPAADPEEALALLGGRAAGTADPYELVLTDLVMPGMDGADLAQRIRRVAPDIRVVYMSGYVEEAVLTRVADDRCATLLEKPFRASALLRAVEAQLARLRRG